MFAFCLLCVCVWSADAVRYQYTFKNSVGFGAEFSMLMYAGFVGERRIAADPASTFCINRFTGWRFMPCNDSSLECLFEPQPPFQRCPPRAGMGDRAATVQLDGLHFSAGDLMSFADAVRYSRRIFVPNVVLRQFVSEKMARLGLVHGEFIGVHIRRGDSAWEKGEWLPIQRFLEVAHRAASELPALKRPLTLFVATDTQEVVDYLDVVVSGDPHFRIVVDRQQIRFNLTRAQAADLEHLGPLTFSTEAHDDHALQFLSDLSILALHSAAFVGTLVSNVGTLTAELRGGERVHFVDVLGSKAGLRVSSVHLNVSSVDKRPRETPVQMAPLQWYWPSFFGVWPPPERVVTAEAEHQARNPLWWWRSLLYGRSKKFNVINAAVLKRERQEIEERKNRK